MRRSRGPRCLLLAAALCLIAAAPGPPSSATARKRVLALYFSMRQAPLVADMDGALRRELADGLGDRLDFSSEHIDPIRLPDPGYQSAVRTYLRSKYVENPPDLVIATSASLVPFVTREPILFPDVPVVYTSGPGVTAGGHSAGVVSPIDFRGTLDAALTAQPDTRHVFLVGGSAPGEPMFRDLFRQQNRDLEARVTFHDLVGLGVAELEERLRQLPANSIIYYLGVFGDDAGRTHSAVDVADAISAAANAPMYAWHEGFLGHGIVGGRLHSVVNDARETARIAVRVLNGQRPDTIGARAIDSGVLEFDARQLQRWRIPESRLPAHSTIVFRQPSALERYRVYVLGGAVVFAAQLVLIGGLLIQRTLRRRAEDALRAVTVRNSAILRAVPDLMFVNDRDGTYVDYHARDRSLLFVPPEVFMGRTIRDVMPPALADRFVDALARVTGDADPVVVEYDLPLDELRHFEVRMMPIDHGRVLSVVRDVTESRRAMELNRTLAGRLITSQEDERQRIARELHDDMAQRLSLLAVDLGTIGRRNESVSADMRTSLAKLSAQAAALGGDLQRVSHELHPATLTQLGLETAVRGFCRELAQARHIAVNVETRNIPPALAPDVALGLYRVVQEALQNVVRHSGASRATVTLAGEDGALVLTIADQGGGFNPGAATGHAALGLTSMSERVRLAGGTLSVESRPGGGTRVEARVPLQAAV
jgi:signal transduction histidine kinase